MKKLLAWAMAILMTATPFTALAEDAYALRMSWELDDSAVVSLFQDESAEEVKALARLINSLGYQLQWQPDAFSFGISMKDEGLLEVALAQQDGVLGITGTVMPGVVLTLSEDQLPTQLFSEQTNALLTVALPSLWTDAAALWADFLTALEPTEETGNFVGNAFANGVRRRLYRVDDRDIGLLLGDLVDIIADNQALAAWCDVLDISLAEVAREARAWIRSVSLANEYRYEISVVYDAAGELTGVSATALRLEEQVATLSAGLREDMLEVVLGWGMAHGNKYLRLTLMWQESGGSWYLRLINDPARAGFDAVADQASASLLNAYGSFSLSPTEQGHDIDLILLLDGKDFSLSQSAQGHYREAPFEMTMKEQTYINESETPYLTRQWQISAVEAVTPDWSDCAVIDLLNLSDEDKETLAQVEEEGTRRVMVKLLRLLPSELLTYILMNELN